MAYKILAPRRFYSLDVLRGVAAFSIVLWHWNFFFLPANTHGVIFHPDKQPLFKILYIFYTNGNAAVDFFFCISGFIFFWLYSKRIADKSISLKSFSILRLSRLYPLHFVTLIFVAVGQLVYVGMTNESFVYPYNDTYHFFLNLFFVSAWGVEKGLSFNGPIWSVSVEMLLYLMFFIFCRIFNRNLTALIFVVILGYFAGRFNAAIGSGVMFFFIGALVLIAYEKIITTSDVWKVSIWLPWVTSIAWLVIIIVVYSNHDIAGNDAPWIIKRIAKYAVIALFPITIMSLALIETKRGSFGKRLIIIGDISYSSYLLHFPLQLAIVLLTANLAIGQALFYSTWFMAAFFLILFLVCFASHRYFEMPIQRYLRQIHKARVNTADV